MTATAPALRGRRRAAYLAPARTLQAFLLLACLAAATAVQAGGITDACDAEAHADTLRHAAWTPPHARAHWLDAGTIRWPDMPVDGRYALHHARGGGLAAPAGDRVTGADERVALRVRSATLDGAVTARFAFTGAGAELVLPADLAPGAVPALLRGQLVLVQEDDDGRVLQATSLQVAGALDALHADAAAGHALGAMPSASGTRFALWAPTAHAVALCLYPDDDGPATSSVALRRDDASGVWTHHARDDLRGRYFTYLVDVFVPGTGLVRNRVTDPYAVSLGADSRRAYIADLDDPVLAPRGWDASVAPARVAAQADMVIYELHVRDFSRDDATVPPALRGRYLGFTATGSDGMRHLQGLAWAGVTDVHLLPVFDIATVPETGCVIPDIPDAAPDSDAQQAAVMAVAAVDCFNWGYDPLHFTAPEGSYATDAADGAVRIRELRAMVMALHAAGLRVGMDVVYNHTSASGQDPQSVLDRIVPGYYHRLDADGAVTRSTCCDNTATEHSMMARLMIDSAVVWARDHRIDSFRFDLMGHQPRDAMLRLKQRVDAAAGRDVQLIGEGWNFGEVADGARFVQASQLSLGGTGIGTFSDRGRDAIRGGGPSDGGDALAANQGYINGLVYAPNDAAPARPRDHLLRAADLVRVGLAGSLRDVRMTTFDGRTLPLSAIDYVGQPAGYAAVPGEVVNYVENHDNQTLYDSNAWKLPRGTSSADRARVQVLALALTAFSQGVAYFHAGVDTLRSKSLDRNSYDSGDWFNRLDWTYRDNFFGTGLPPAPDNAADWARMRPLLADSLLRPAAADIAFARDAFRDLLRIRASTPLFRLRSAAEVQSRLRFPNTGPAQDPLVMAGMLDGRGMDDAVFDAVLYLVNVAPEARTLVVPDALDVEYVLHPVHAAHDAADGRIRQDARFDARTGGFTVPARSAAVYVVPRGSTRPGATGNGTR